MPVTAAVRIRDHSGDLHVEQVDLAEPGPREVLVELAYAGVNPVDQYTAKGLVAADGPVPRTLGGEAAGHLDGRPVLVAGAGLGAARDGVWASRAVVPREAVLPLPHGVDLAQAACAGVAGLTAWGTVVDLGQVTAADRVLVLGASGGVGLAIVSLAASLGAEVWGQLRGADAEPAVRAAGAAGVVVAEADRLEAAAGDLDPTVVIDAVAGPYVRPALALLGAYGRYVVFGTSAGAEVSLDWQTVYRRHLEVLGYGGLVLDQDERREKLQQVLRALADGRLTVPVGRTVPLAEAARVFERGGTPGKTVLDVQGRAA